MWRIPSARLTSNAALKAIALVVSVALFLFVRADRASEITLDLPVSYRLPRDRVLVSEPVSHLRITVRGAWTRISQLEPRDLDAPLVVDLEHVPSGTYRFAPELVKAPREVRVVSVSPDAMELAFEPRTTRMVPVEARLYGQPAAGFRIGRVVVTPDEVAVSGAQSVVDGISHVQTAPVSVLAARASLARKVDLAALPPRAEVEHGRPVDVEVEVVPLGDGTSRVTP